MKKKPKARKPDARALNGKSPPMSVGRALLLRVGLTEDEVAEKLGVDRSLVAHWQRGARIPTKAARLALELFWNIPTSAWDRLEREAPYPPPAPVAYEPKTTIQRAEQLDREIQSLLDDRRGEPFARAKVLRTCATALQMLAKINGSDLTEGTILRTVHWRRLEGTIEEALKPFPDAMKALAEALHKLSHP